MLRTISGKVYNIKNTPLLELSETLRVVLEEWIEVELYVPISDEALKSCIEWCKDKFVLERVYQDRGIKGLVELINCSDYLNIPPLTFDVCTFTLSIIKGKKVSELRELFGT